MVSQRLGTDEKLLIDTVTATVEAAESDPHDAFARLAASVICEPGDGVFGELALTLGYETALSVVLKSDDASDFARGISHAADLVGLGGAVTDLSLPMLSAALGRWKPRLQLGHVLEAARRARFLGARAVVPASARWPAGIDDLGPHAPALLWHLGQHRDAGPRVAVVGSRAATAYGERAAGDIAGSLAAAGVEVVSGAAYGVDGASHRAALAEGGFTSAYLAGGIDRWYPAGNRGLLAELSRRGAIWAECPPGTSPSRWRFLARNRLIAASSLAVVVVEAAARSGALNTAHHALALGRHVFALPGSLYSPASVGAHRLVRDSGATLLCDINDILEDLGLAEAGEPVGVGEDAEMVRVRDALSNSPAEAWEISRHSGVDYQRVPGILAELEIRGHVRRSATGWMRVPVR